MTTGRHILARVLLDRTEGGYDGVLPLYGFAYHLEFRKNGDKVEVTAFDGPAIGAYRIPVVDDAKEE